jgi:hypothetical protein
MMIWIKRLIITATFLALIATNILTLTHTAFNAALSGLLRPMDGLSLAYGSIFVIFDPCMPIPAIKPAWPKMKA